MASAVGTRIRKEAKGWSRHTAKGEVRRIQCEFDVDTFELINARAAAANTSFVEQVRLLVEWGLEA